MDCTQPTVLMPLLLPDASEGAGNVCRYSWHRRRNLWSPETIDQALRAARPKAVLALESCKFLKNQLNPMLKNHVLWVSAGDFYGYP